MIDGLANRGLATLTTEKVLANERLTVVAMVRITEAGRLALAAEDWELKFFRRRLRVRTMPRLDQDP
jgi:hypothetical protein